MEEEYQDLKQREGPPVVPISVADCMQLQQDLLAGSNLIIVSNRGPGTWQSGEDGVPVFERGGGGLVTALLGLAHRVRGSWVSAAMSDDDRILGVSEISLGDDNQKMRVHYVKPEPDAYNDYYNVIANPLLWFLQHSMWDFVHAPTITRETWSAWENGYKAVNRLFADATLSEIRSNPGLSLVMLQDYHLYLAPRMIRKRMAAQRGPNRKPFILSFFVHIPWPGVEDWSVLPPAMRQDILDGLCAVDLLGFQTRLDALNFIRTCETLLKDARVNYHTRRVLYRNHITHVRDFPISIDVEELRLQAESQEVDDYRLQLEALAGDTKLIVRIDRTEPSKNIVRGFQAFEELLETHPEHVGKVKFLALLVPSRLEVSEYQNYLDEINAAAGRVNARYGSSDWEPVRVLVGENMHRAMAAQQIYDVLLVNPVVDGMNLVAKEGPILNRKDGVIVLSERAGASQQLGAYVLVVSPFDVHATAEALHTALTMAEEQRKVCSNRLRESVEREDISAWLCGQLDEIKQLKLGEK